MKNWKPIYPKLYRLLDEKGCLEKIDTPIRLLYYAMVHTNTDKSPVRANGSIWASLEKIERKL